MIMDVVEHSIVGVRMNERNENAPVQMEEGMESDVNGDEIHEKEIYVLF